MNENFHLAILFWCLVWGSILQEHVVHMWQDPSSEFHNILAIQYKDTICDMMEKLQIGNECEYCSCTNSWWGLHNKSAFFRKCFTFA